VSVYKKGPTTNVANYRPMSLTSAASKICSVQMTSFLLHNNLINAAQHGFLRGLSTTSNLLETFIDWTLAIQGQNSITVAYIDFAKAFDTVSHVELLYRVQYYGIDGCLPNWIKNFLSGRTHTNRVGSVVLEPFDLCTSGTIRGSGIGPLLFIVYINQLAGVLSEYKVAVKNFADDLKLYAVLATDRDVSNFNTALKCIEEWANT